MRSRWAFAPATCLLLAATVSSGAGATTKVKPAPSGEAASKLARSSNAFGFDLYQRLRQKPGNLVLSPASVTAVLTLAWGGDGLGEHARHEESRRAGEHT